MAICGVRIRMADSDTALNGAMFKCCDLPNYDGSDFKISSNSFTIPTTESQMAKSSILVTNTSNSSGKYLHHCLQKK